MPGIALRLEAGGPMARSLSHTDGVADMLPSLLPSQHWCFCNHVRILHSIELSVEILKTFTITTVNSLNN